MKFCYNYAQLFLTLHLCKLCCLAQAPLDGKKLSSILTFIALDILLAALLWFSLSSFSAFLRLSLAGFFY